MTSKTDDDRSRGDGILWDLRADCPGLAGELERVDGWASQYYLSLGDPHTLAGPCEPFDEGDRFRPFRHVRTHYRRGPSGTVVAIKGSEVLAPGLRSLLADLGRFRINQPRLGPSLWSAIEYFPIFEQKVPAALLRHEALAEARLAAEFQSAYLERYGELASVPLPLRVYAWPEERVTSFRVLLRPLLSERAAAIVERLLEDGLACYVYQFPCTPTRVVELTRTLEQVSTPLHGFPGRRDALAARTDPVAAVQGWISLVARMLALGYFPVRLSHFGIGQCLDPQNAVISGALADLGSLHPIAGVTDARMFHETFLAVVWGLARTSRELLLGTLPVPAAEYDDPSLTSLLLVTTTSDALLARLRAEVVGGAALDSRFEPLLASTAPLRSLEEILAILYPRLSAISSHA